MPPPPAPVRLLLRLVDEGYDHKAWHGPNLRGAVRRVDPVVAAFRPAPDRKTVWEHAVHCAYWKYVVTRRITGGKRGSFPVKGSNWFARPDPAVHPGDWAAAWAADLKLLDACHRGLRAVVEGLSPDELDVVPPNCKVTVVESVAGVAMHDVYHAGQIQLLKRLAVETERG